MNFEFLGKILITFALFLLLFGLIFFLLGRGFGISRLPGDIFYRRGNFTFSFPLVTGLLLSLFLTILLNLFLYFFRR